MRNTAHHFFLYDASGSTTKLAAGEKITLNPELSSRIATILRLSAGETCTLFANTGETATLELTSVLAGKGAKVQATVIATSTTAPLQPKITLICGITKQATFEEICYTATQLGVSQIFPVTTQKSYTKAYNAKDMNRFMAQAIAAAEQSKQIFLPKIYAPSPLKAVLQNDFVANSTKVFFEADGQPFSIILHEQITHLTAAFGPEGGFTNEEGKWLEEAHFKRLKLCTPILRSQDAVEVGLGIIRCLF